MAAKILVIEDNAANLDLIVYLLTAFGFAMLAARDGEQGLALAAAELPDLIVCDIQIPKLDGYEVTARLKGDSVTRHIPIIAITALAMVGDRERIMQAGFDGYIAKPINPELLVQQIAPYLGRRFHSPVVRAEARLPGGATRPDTKWTVLAVDDVRTNLELVRSLLEPFGFRVITAFGGREALEKVRQDRPDLILADVCMSDGGGYEFIQAVKADSRLAGIPFIFLTSSTTDEREREKGMALGAARFLFRPIEPERLLAEITKCLATGVDRGLAAGEISG